MFKQALKVILFSFCVLIFSSQTYAQWIIPSQMRSEVTLDHLLSSNGSAKPDLSFGNAMSIGSTSGHNYIDQKWNNCSILLFDSQKLIEGYLAKYDISENKLAVKSKSGTKLIEVIKIKSIVWLDSLTSAPRYFINAKDYKEDNTQLSGLLEVLVDGQVPLLARSYLKEKEIGFFSGLFSLFDKEKREKKYEVDKFFYVGSGNSVSKISAKREFLLSFGDFYWEMEEYIEKNNLNISTQIGLQKVFEYYNTKFERLPDY